MPWTEPVVLTEEQLIAAIRDGLDRMKGKRAYPLVRDGEGWSEVVNPEPGTNRYPAYRVECDDPKCPEAWPDSTHCHIHVL